MSPGIDLLFHVGILIFTENAKWTVKSKIYYPLIMYG